MSRSHAAVLAFELAPLEDELLGGWLARHRAMLGLTTHQGFAELALGRRSFAGSPLLPAGLAELPDRLPSGLYDHERLLSEHTAFPYFASFGPAERVSALVKIMRDGWVYHGPRSF